MDLTALNTARLSEEGTWMTLRHPVTGTPLTGPGGPARLRLIGRDSRRYQQRRYAVAAESRNRAARRVGWGAAEIAEADQDVIDLVATCIVASENIELDGQSRNLGDPATALDLLGDPGFTWIVEQADRWIHDRGNFLPGSPATS